MPDMSLFESGHLQDPDYRILSGLFEKVAQRVDTLPISTPGMREEKTVALRKLLEAKDCAVRVLVLAKQEENKGR